VKKRLWIVTAPGYGVYSTMAISEKKTISNIRWIIADGRAYDLPNAWNWKARPA